MRESRFTAAVGRLLPPEIYRLKLCLRFANGVADSWYSGPKRDLWVEWKHLATLPLIVDATKLLTAKQAAWLRDRAAEGRNVAVIIGCANGGVIFPGLSWEIPITREEFFKRCIAKKQIAKWIESAVSTVAPTRRVRHSPTQIKSATVADLTNADSTEGKPH